MFLEYTIHGRVLTMVGGVDAKKHARLSTRLLLWIILWVRKIRDAAARAHDDTVDLAMCLPHSPGGDGDAIFYPSNQGVLLCARPIQCCCVLVGQSVDHAMCWPHSPAGAVDATKLTPVVFSQLSFEADGKTLVCTINGKPATEHDKDYVPFFFVSSSMEQSESNVSSTLYPCVAFGGDYNVPVLVNHKLIKAGDEVKMYFKTVNAKPNTIVAFPHQPARGEAAADTQGALPKKKARKT